MIKYAISIGRRQPIHIVHYDCIKEILNKGLTPIVIMGSNNTPKNKFYDVLKNPLNIAQLNEQLKITLGSINYISFAVKDCDHEIDWVEDIISNLRKLDINENETLMHFRKKINDQKTINQPIKSLSHYQQLFIDSGIQIWESVNQNKAFDQISSTYFRQIDLEKMTKEEKDILTCPGYIVAEARKARFNNGNKKLIEHLPITMLDLSLAKLKEDIGLETKEILHDKKPNSIQELARQIAVFLHNDEKLIQIRM